MTELLKSPCIMRGKYNVVFRAWDETGNESILTIPVELTQGRSGGSAKERNSAAGSEMEQSADGNFSRRTAVGRSMSGYSRMVTGITVTQTDTRTSDGCSTHPDAGTIWTRMEEWQRAGDP